MKKRILSTITALALALTLLPTAAFAAEPDGSEDNPYLLTQKIVDDADGKLTLEKNKHYKLNENIGVKQTIYLNGNGSLDLNGHVLYWDKSSASSPFLSKHESGTYTYTLFDSSAANPTTAPKHYFSVRTDGLWVWDKTLEDTTSAEPDAYKVVSGGVITGGKYSDGGCLKIGTSGATVELESGSIVGCYAGNYGGAVCANDSGRKFIMSGGSIKGCISKRGGALYADDGGELEMSGGTIEDCVATDDTFGEKGRGGAVYIESGASFTMTGGTIKNCKTVYADGTGGEGGAVYTNGVFNMNAAADGSGGIIESCFSADNGGAVFVDANGEFTMTAGTIRNSSTNNTDSYYGGGVYNKGTFTMPGGTIGNCEAYEGGGVYNNGAFKMEAGTGNTSGTIEDCKANAKGGGVFNASEKTFDLSAGRIKDCYTLNFFDDDTIDGKGGGVYNNGTFNMSGGEIKGSSCAAIEGAAVSNDAGGTFNMTNGTISTTSNNDDVKRGGGVSNTGSGVSSTTFNMSGGSISRTTAEEGGGVYNKGANFNMTGGTISNCVATTGEGGNIYNQGTFKLSGDAEVGTSTSASAVKQVAGDDASCAVKFTTDGGTVKGATVIAAGSVEQSANATVPTVFYTEPEFADGTRLGKAVRFTSDSAFYALEVVSEGNKAVAPIAPTKTGYTLKGWDTSGPGTRFFFDDTEITEDTALVAAWRDSSSTEYDVLKRSATGGSFVTDKESANEGDTVTVTVTPNANYSIGTVTATYGEGTSVTVNNGSATGEYTFTMPAGDVTVSVTFVRNTYTITLDVNGGDELDSDTLTTDTVTGALSTLPTPTRSGYRFDGWFNAKTGGTKVSSDTVYSAHATLYAYWTKLGTSASCPIVLTQADVTNSTLTLTLEVGKYYELGENISIPNPATSQWETWAIKISGDVTLNLNGYMLKGPGANSSNNLSGAIQITQGATLTLKDDYDSTRTDVTRYFGVNANGLWTLEDSGVSENSVTGGFITGFYGNNGGGVYNDGTLNMMGGTIVGCYGESSIINNDSSFNMTGGSIIGCVTSNTGIVKNKSTFTMTGGTIKNCAVNGNDKSGIIYNKKNATLNLANGTITQCNVLSGGAVFVNAGGTFNVGGKDSAPGKVSITENTGSNVYLDHNCNNGHYTAVRVTTAGLKTGSSIGINMSAPMDSFAIITGLTDSSKNYFSSDMAGYSFLHDNGNAYLVKNYRVTFDVNGGEALSSNYSGTNADGKLSSLPNATRSGNYRFGGWFTEATGGTQVTEETEFTAHTTVYAHWIAPSYSIGENAIGSGIMRADRTRAKAGETVTVTVTPEAHYHMDSISVTYTNEGNSTPVSVSQVEGQANKYAFLMPAADVTIAVTFVRDSYTVTFNANGGDALSPASGGTNADGKLDTLPTPTRSGSYSFAGWFTEATGGTQVTVDTVFNGNTTIYAHWTYTGSGGGSYTPSYSVTVPTNTKNGSVSVDTKNAKQGDTVTITLTPDAGYTVETITVLDKNGKEIEVTDLGNGKYSFKMPAGKVEIKATFAEDNTMLNFFTDVSADKYYYDAVLWAVKNGVTKGTTDTTFSPEASCSRAQLVTFLWRVAGCPVVNYAMNFSDVAEDAFYSEAIRWAASLNIVGGYGNGLFGTNDTITREQVVAILYRFAVSQGLDLSAGEDTNILSYNDALQVAEYAISAFQWACGEGIVQGANGSLMPKDECIRAQIVTMLYRMPGRQ